MSEANEAPDPALLEALIQERHGEPVSVDVDEKGRAIALLFKRDRHVYRLRVAYLRNGGARDPWLLTADAVDNLFGMLLESGCDYRALPTGTDVSFEDAFFSVFVSHEIPELEKLADQILGDDS